MKPETKFALQCHDCECDIHVGDWAMIQYTDGKGTVYCGPCAQARYGEDIVHREGPLQPEAVH